MGLVLTAALALSLPVKPVADEWSTPTPAEALNGWATYYAPAVMAHVAVHRGLVEDADEFPGWLEARGLAGAVALNRAGDWGAGFGSMARAASRDRSWSWIAPSAGTIPAASGWRASSRSIMPRPGAGICKGRRRSESISLRPIRLVRLE